MVWIVLLIAHGLLALALIGALTHQAVSVVWHPRKRNFVERFAAVGSTTYVNAIIILFALAFVFGSIIYSDYRTEVRPVFEMLGWHSSIGLFELKEHFLALTLALIPTYWFVWKKMEPTRGLMRVRQVLTVLMAVSVWYGFLAGHILNDLRGLGA